MAILHSPRGDTFKRVELALEPTEYQAETCDKPRTGIIKAEMHAGGENRRAEVSDRLAAWDFSKAIYDAYTERGKSENRNFELKCDLRAER